MPLPADRSAADNVPPQPVVANGGRIRARALAQFFGTPIGKGRHDIAERTNEAVAFLQYFVDLAAFHDVPPHQLPALAAEDDFPLDFTQP